MTIFPTSTSLKLAKRVAKIAGATLGKVSTSRFADGELFVTASGSSARPVVFGSVHQPNDHLFELLFTIDAVHRLTKRKPKVAIPYLPYARQDREEPKGSAVGAKLIADMIEVAGADSVITLDIHSDAAAGFFSVPLKNISAMSLLAGSIRGPYDDLVVVAPDHGAIERARLFGRELSKASIATVEKIRPAPGKAKAVSLAGEVRGRKAVIVDDMIDTGGTIIEAAKILRAHGAVSVAAVATHGIFSHNAVKQMRRAGVHQIVTTDTIPQTWSPFVKVISVADLLAHAI